MRQRFGRDAIRHYIISHTEAVSDLLEVMLLQKEVGLMHGTLQAKSTMDLIVVPLFETIEDLRKNYSGPIFVDTKKSDLARCEGCYVKINQLEYEAAKTYPTELIVTLGRDGVRYKEHTISTPQVEAFDVCGAGDTFLSALAYNYVLYKDMLAAIKFATRAASVTIQHVGVYSPTLDEILKEYDKTYRVS